MWRSIFIWAKYNKLIHAFLENGAEVREYSCPPPPSPLKKVFKFSWMNYGRPWFCCFSNSWGNLRNLGKRLPNRPRSSATLLGRPKDVTKSFSPLWLLEFIWVEWSISFCEKNTYHTHVCFCFLLCFLGWRLFSGNHRVETFPLMTPWDWKTLETIRGQAFRGMYSCVRDLLPTTELVSMFRISMSLA